MLSIFTKSFELLSNSSVILNRIPQNPFPKHREPTSPKTTISNLDAAALSVNSQSHQSNHVETLSNPHYFDEEEDNFLTHNSTYKLLSEFAQTPSTLQLEYVKNQTQYPTTKNTLKLKLSNCSLYAKQTTTLYYQTYYFSEPKLTLLPPTHKHTTSQDFKYYIASSKNQSFFYKNFDPYSNQDFCWLKDKNYIFHDLVSYEGDKYERLFFKRSLVKTIDAF